MSTDHATPPTASGWKPADKDCTDCFERTAGGEMVAFADEATGRWTVRTSEMLFDEAGRPGHARAAADACAFAMRPVLGWTLPADAKPPAPIDAPEGALCPRCLDPVEDNLGMEDDGTHTCMTCGAAIAAPGEE